MKNKKIIICSIIIVLGIFGIVKVANYLINEYIVVSGTVYGKNEGISTKYKSTAINSEFWIAVHPDDSVTYKDYDVNVSYSTFARLNIGSHTQFSVLRNEVERNYDGYYSFFVILLCTLCIFEFASIVCFIWFILD